MKNSKLTIMFLALILTAVLSTSCSSSSAGSSESTNTIIPTSAVVTKITSLSSEELIEEGEYQFEGACSGCHGENAKGLPNLGKDLVDSSFVTDINDNALSEFIKVGRSAGDKDNTTGIDMPPKGGNPALSDPDIKAITAFLRSLQK